MTDAGRMNILETPPIACTLDTAGFRQRISWIAGLNARMLRSSRRNDLVMTLEYAPDAIAEVRRMVAGEQACCAFLRFDVAVNAGAVVVTVSAPEAARATVDDLFAAFAASGPHIDESR